MARHKDVNWNLPETSEWNAVHAALLMDIRDELKESNQRLRRVQAILECGNTQDIPSILRRISRNTAKPKPKPKKAAKPRKSEP